MLYHKLSFKTKTEVTDICRRFQLELAQKRSIRLLTYAALTSGSDESRHKMPLNCATDGHLTAIDCRVLRPIKQITGHLENDFS